MISAPPSGKTALQFGAIFGVSLSVLQIALVLTTLSRFIPTPMFFFGLPALAFLLAGLFAAKRTGKVSTGALAGLWSGISSILLVMATLFIVLLTVGHDVFVQGAMRSSVDPRYAQQYAWLGLVIFTIIVACLMAGCGSGLGALGGLIGKSMSPLAPQFYSPNPLAPLPMQAYQEFLYQSAPPLPHHVYRLRPMWRVFYAGIYPLLSVIAGLGLMGKYLGSFGSSAFSLFMIGLIVVVVGYNIYYGIRMSMSRLLTSPSGVMYYGVGFRIYVPWRHITGIDKVWKRMVPITGLTFQTPVVRTQSESQAFQEQGPVIEVSFWRRPFYKQYTKLIPLTWFVGNLQNSALGDDIRWSAPHLLESIPSASSDRHARVIEMAERGHLPGENPSQQ
jgi:hypothetical protein